MSGIDIIIFAGCSTADPDVYYNMPRSAELAGAKVAIGWSVTQYGNEMNEWIDYFFSLLCTIDPNTGEYHDASRALEKTNYYYRTAYSSNAIIFGREQSFSLKD